MFLKNKSDSLTVVLRTKKGFKKVEPNKIIEVDKKDLLTALNSNLEEVKEAPQIVEPESSKTPETPVEPQQPKQDPETPVEPQKDATTDQPTVDTVPTQTEETVEVLEAKIETLKKNWTNTSRPKKKEAIQKEIKEVQVKLDKLKENK